MNLRKVALVVASLDRDAADQLLDHLPTDQARAVRDAVIALTDVDATESSQAIQEFIGSGSRPTELSSAIDYRSAGSAVSSELRTSPSSSSGASAAADGSAIDRASERLIADCLRNELPQAIAVALAQLPTRRASEVVSHLPADQQAEVLERMVELDPASSLEQSDVLDAFQQWLSEQIERALHRSELASRLASLLEATHTGTRRRILHNVSSSDAELAKELQHQLARHP